MTVDKRTIRRDCTRMASKPEGECPQQNEAHNRQIYEQRRQNGSGRQVTQAPPDRRDQLLTDQWKHGVDGIDDASLAPVHPRFKHIQLSHE
jgi:hypothetical protein